MIIDRNGTAVELVAQSKENFPEMLFSSHVCFGCVYHGAKCDDFIAGLEEQCVLGKVFAEVK
jgi:hypothetical protein